jgi:hypothetical protein
LRDGGGWIPLREMMVRRWGMGIRMDIPVTVILGIYVICP